ncbi:sulfatase [Maribellus sediminis]|uniref:sulfatase family protein n=1 Tax=Maribellus sediminis TaxID=2696285 RepID=UPI00142FEAE7|nr:sulfatase [Maribellus sediminis]
MINRIPLQSKRTSFIILLFLIAFINPSCKTESGKPTDKPNILMITSEDNSAYFLGCYGNEMATTPNLDKLAAEGFMYTRAFANCPVCAPARNTILTGVYAASNGSEQMRSKYAKSEIVKTYPEYFREAGYYCTNNVKTDYNYAGDWNAIWDECSRTATYNNRQPGQPFFAVFSNFTTHESQIHKQIPTAELKHDPAKVEIAPYHPDLPEIRHDWAQYYDRNEQMDAEIGQILKELEESGEAENTIVIYYGDHGGVLARSKRYVYETGTRVPFIIRIPEKYQKLFPAKNPGEPVERIVSFVDLLPTFLSIIGVETPDHLQGNAFLGEQKTKNPEYAFMTRQRMDERFDMVRAVRDNKYRYIRNYMPFRITMQHLDYLFRASSAQAWEDAFKAGKTNQIQSLAFLEKPLEELYDTENDPWEINNLAENPEYAEVLERMRKAETEWMRETRDVGLIPEMDYQYFAGQGALYDYMRSEDCPFEELLEAAQQATIPDTDIEYFIRNLQNENRAIRYWGAVGLLIHRDKAASAVNALKVAVTDSSSAVATLAAETLFRMNYQDLAISSYERILADTITYSSLDRCFALNSVDAVNASSPFLKSQVEKVYFMKPDQQATMVENYDQRIAKTLLLKWDMLADETN